jgi:hypothetical protein
MSHRHIVIARRMENVPNAWGRVDFDGATWRDSGMVLAQSPARAVVAQTALKALIDGALTDLAEADLTIASRTAMEIVARGNPASLNIPSDASALILCPIGRPGAAHQADHWCPVFIQPAQGICKPLLDKVFVQKRLPVVLREMLTREDIAARCALHDRRELWVRRDLTAAQMCPAEIEPYIAKPVDSSADTAIIERQQQKARSERARGAGQRSVEAGKADRAAAAEYSAKQAKARASQQK